MPDLKPGGCRGCDIAALAICAGLDGAERQLLLSVQSMLQLGPGSTLFREGDAADHMFSVSQGSVKLYKLLADGRRQITGFLFPGDFFGLALAGGYAYTAEAITPVQLCRFPRRRLEDLFDELPRLEKRLLRLTVDELATAHEQMLLLGRKTAREKVASFLIRLSDRAVRVGEAPSPVALPMSRSDIGDFLGLTIETVSRTLTAFKKEALIGLPDLCSVQMLDPESLRRIADGAPG